MPGSRRQEVRGILPELLKSARLLNAAHADLRFAIPIARPELRPMIEGIVQAIGEGLPLTLLDGRAHEVMQALSTSLGSGSAATCLRAAALTAR